MQEKVFDSTFMLLRAFELKDTRNSICEGWNGKGFRLHSRILIALDFRLDGLFMGGSIPAFVFWVMLHPHHASTLFHACLLVGFHQKSKSGLWYELEGGMWAKLYLGNLVGLGLQDGRALGETRW